MSKKERDKARKVLLQRLIDAAIESLLLPEHADLDQADYVEIVYAKHDDGWRLWVNVDGQNRFRAYRIKQLHVQVEPDE